MPKEGYIKDWRQELDSNIWLMPPMYHRVWQWIKYSANFLNKKIPNKDGTFTTLEPGQCATSYRIIASGVGYYEGKVWKEPNVKTIKTILDWLVKQKMISVCGNTNGTIITVANWELYQLENDQGNTKRAKPSTQRKHQLDTKKNVKNDKNVKNNKGIYGEYKNVSLTDEEYSKVQNEFPDYADRIERLSEYIASTGKTYKSHIATIRSWARKDSKAKSEQKGTDWMDLDF